MGRKILIFLIFFLVPLRVWAMSPDTEKRILAELAEIKATLKTYMASTTLTAVVIAFAYWDRRTIINKALEETLRDLEEGKLGALIRALRDLARENPRLAEILRSYGLL